MFRPKRKNDDISHVHSSERNRNIWVLNFATLTILFILATWFGLLIGPRKNQHWEAFQYFGLQAHWYPFVAGICAAIGFWIFGSRRWKHSRLAIGCVTFCLIGTIGVWQRSPERRLRAILQNSNHLEILSWSFEQSTYASIIEWYMIATIEDEATKTRLAENLRLTDSPFHLILPPVDHHEFIVRACDAEGNTTNYFSVSNKGTLITFRPQSDPFTSRCNVARGESDHWTSREFQIAWNDAISQRIIKSPENTIPSNLKWRILLGLSSEEACYYLATHREGATQLDLIVLSQQIGKYRDNPSFILPLIELIENEDPEVCAAAKETFVNFLGYPYAHDYFLSRNKNSTEQDTANSPGLIMD